MFGVLLNGRSFSSASLSLASISAQLKLRGTRITYSLLSFISGPVRLSYCPTVSMDVPLLRNDFSVYAANFAEMYMSRTGKTIKCKVVTQREIIREDGGTSWRVYLSVVDSKGKIINAGKLKWISSTDYSKYVKIGKYKLKHRSRKSLKYGRKLKRCGRFRLKKHLGKHHYHKCAKAIKRSLSKKHSRYNKAEIKILKTAAVYSSSGKRSYNIYYSVTIDGKTISRVELDSNLDGTLLTQEMKVESMLSSSGLLYSATIDSISSLTTKRLSTLFSSIYLSKRIQTSNYLQVQLAVGRKYLKILRAMYGEQMNYDIKVKIFSQQENIIKSKGGRRRGHRCYFSITVDGLQISALTALPIGDITSEFSTISIIGSSLKLDTSLMKISTADTVYEYNSLYSFNVNSKISTNNLLSVSAIMQEKIKIQMGLIMTDTVKVTIVNQEDITVDGIKTVKVSYTLDINGVIQDDRETYLSQETLTTTLKKALNIVDVEVSVVLETDTSIVFRDDLSEKWCFRQTLTLVDITNIMLSVNKSYSERNVTVVYSRIEKMITTKNEIVQCVRFNIVDLFTNIQVSITIETSLIRTVLIENAATINFANTIIFDLSITEMYSYSSVFYALLKRQVRTEHRVDILLGLQIEWRKIKTGVNITFAEQEEFIDLNGNVIYKFAYFVIASDGTFLDARTSSSISIDSLKLAFAAHDYMRSLLSTLSLDGLIAYSDLFRLTIRQKVSVSHKTDIAHRIKQTWIALQALYIDVVITIKTTEVYINMNNEYFNVLLYTATMNGVTIGQQDMSSVLELPSLTGLIAANGEQYTIVLDMNLLLRYNMGVSIQFDKWVKDSDMTNVLSSISSIINENRPGSQLEVKFSIQEIYIDNSNIEQVHFTYFLFSGNTLQDGSIEITLSKSKLQASLNLLNMKYNVVTTLILSGPVNIRYCFKIIIQGFVQNDHLDHFKTPLVSDWNAVHKQLLNIRIMKSEEYIGDNGDAITAIYYLVMDISGALVLPGTIVIPSISELSQSSSVIFKGSQKYVLYIGTTMVQLNKQYDVVVTGDIDLGQSKNILESMLINWQQHLGILEVNITLIATKGAFGKFGLEVTRILYSLQISGVFKSPVAVSPPSVSSSNTSAIPYYIGAVLSNSNLFYLNIDGTLTSNSLSSIEQDIAKKWTVSTSKVVTCKVAGSRRMRKVQGGGKLNKMYYSITFNGVLQSKSSAISPDWNKFTLPSGFKAYRLPSIYVRSLKLDGYKARSSTEISALVVSITKSWEADNIEAKSSGQITISIVGQQRISQSDWSYATSIKYTVLYSGSSSLRIPSSTMYTKYLDSSNKVCGKCLKSRKLHRMMAKGKNIFIKSRSRSIRKALKSAWSKKNKAILGSALSINLKDFPNSNRRKRSIVEDTIYKDSNGDEITPVDYSVSVDGQEPSEDPAFINIPNEDEISAALATEGAPEQCTSDACLSSLSRCETLLVMGDTQASTTESIGNMIMEAYVLANPSKSRADIILERIAVDNEWESSVGGPMAKLSYCVRYAPSISDTFTIDDLIKPSDANWQSSLTNGLTLATVPAMATKSNGMSTSMIIIICCAVAAVLLFAILITAVYFKLKNNRINSHQKLRNSRRSREFTGVYVDDDKYPGHGIYQGTTLSMTKDAYNVGTMNSKVALYETRVTT